MIAKVKLLSKKPQKVRKHKALPASKKVNCPEITGTKILGKFIERKHELATNVDMVKCARGLCVRLISGKKEKNGNDKESTSSLSLSANIEPRAWMKNCKLQ
jgi:hypothetical protein